MNACEHCDGGLGSPVVIRKRVVTERHSIDCSSLAPDGAPRHRDVDPPGITPQAGAQPQESATGGDAT